MSFTLTFTTAPVTSSATRKPTHSYKAQRRPRFSLASASPAGSDAPQAAHVAERAPTNSRVSAVAQQQVLVYDTTLRDGSQGEGISLSVDDKIRLACRLDEFGVQYIEGGWPGSNPKDAEFFAAFQPERHGRAKLRHGAKLTAFGSTRYKGVTCDTDANVQALLAAETPVVTIVGKAWDMQVDVVLEATREENLRMIGETVAYLKARNKEVMLDAEHFFDGYRANQEYALQCLECAAQNGVDVLVLCDTNGGTQPWEVEAITREVVARFPDQRVGIHAHNDQELAVANSLSAVRAGASVVQGTCNGYGERTGNANLMSIIPNVQLKMSRPCVGDNLTRLTQLSRFVDEIANQPHVPSRPFVGTSAFAHKGGLHVAAVMKNEDTYQHIDPSLVGNVRRVLVSELSGRGNIITRAKELGLYDTAESTESDWKIRSKMILNQVKELENKGYTFEGAEATVELMIRRSDPTYRSPFFIQDFNVVTTNKFGPVIESVSQATVKMELVSEVVEDVASCTLQTTLEVGEGNGPVDALNAAMRRALMSVYPTISSVTLTDYKVRILDNEAATAATTRVMIQFRDTQTKTNWTTVAAHPNIIVASVNALIDGFEYAMLQRAPHCLSFE
eukprot:Plantae.Rhodophyta-Rhodochaete_pulchella.ctg2735.p1 GENE.Plantae.Rhodophyta-Rhodochaete_pulchella.ctg2735~~Plantae.Rhodophyta-Rhodochaete_pulchella.ctg2735.p1  ORF type:complete len:619 (+),score=82.27 Plantae.Rhodophyta-Rhodochaete_pulchella.ctg2735:104-1960(+)